MKAGEKRIAIVTGAGSGIGRSSALQLAEAGFRVGLVGRRRQSLGEVMDEILAAGGEAWTGSLDVGDRSAVDAFVDQVRERYGKIDLLVNNAGVFRLASFEETTIELWEENLAVNLSGVFNFCQAVWPHIMDGQIINISSTAGVQPFPGCAAYSASKYGLMGLSEVLALEGKKRGIRVHVICPGNTQTPLWGDQAPSHVQARFMRPESVAQVVRWLAVSPPDVTFDPVVMRPSVDPWDRV